MDSSQQAHDQSVRSGEILADAENKLKKAEDLLFEANLRMKRARDFESTLIARQKKLDRAFYLLNKQRQALTTSEMRASERETLLHDNLDKF